jgi:hypothetical protein
MDLEIAYLNNINFYLIRSKFTMANIHISDLTTTELQELDLLVDSENGLKNLSDLELNEVQGGLDFGQQSYDFDLQS